MIFLFLLTGRDVLDGLTDAVQCTIVDNKGLEMLLTVIQNLQDKHTDMVEAGDVKSTSTVRITFLLLHFLFFSALRIEIGSLYHDTHSAQLHCQNQQGVCFKNWKDSSEGMFYGLGTLGIKGSPVWCRKRGKNGSTNQQYASNRVLGLFHIQFNLDPVCV